MMEVEYKEGEREGAYIAYSKEGKMEESGTYEQGDKIGIWKP